MHRLFQPLDFLRYLCRFNFGEFEKEEFKKFLKMGILFALIIGVYWTLRPLKDAVFIQLAGQMQLPLAKTASLIALMPIVILYTQLLHTRPKEKMFALLPTFYGIMTLLFSLLIFYAQTAVSQNDLDDLARVLTPFLGYLWYIFVESFGSLIIALFWAYATSITLLNTAKKGFPLIVAIGQIGGIILPYSIGSLPDRLGHQTDSLAILVLGLLILLVPPFLNYFIRTTPHPLMVGFHGKNENDLSESQEPGFFEGARLLVSNRYLVGIFAVNCIYEIIVTLFDFNFKITASEVYTGVALSRYLSLYGSSVNTVSLLSLLLGISNITRYLGVKTALILMPFIVGSALVGFISIDSLPFLFGLMVGSKAINYALNGPALKQLYIPTTPDVKFKAQAWIETFGSRLAKQSGSMFNMTLPIFQSAFGTLIGKSYYLILSGTIAFPLLGLWLITALYLGKKFQKATQEGQTIC